MGNHLLTSMLAPGIAVFVFTRRPAILRRPAVVLAAAGCVALGLLVYAYVPTRAAANPPIHHDFAPTTPELILRYVLGQDFSGSMGFLSARGPGATARELRRFAAQWASRCRPGSGANRNCAAGAMADEQDRWLRDLLVEVALHRCTGRSRPQRRPSGHDQPGGDHGIPSGARGDDH